MFAHRFFAARFYAPRYFGVGTGAAVVHGDYFPDRYFSTAYFGPRYWGGTKHVLSTPSVSSARLLLLLGVGN